ncbi:hypothetical protein BST83_09175 [Polaribacter filamentus]|jgi:hypothetical protein|uniref:Tissue inhibitor of metalloproteinase n=1 Tax=Polaribacter filamentus TaxID=53483 RepID=A0A2S7KXW3_9FLAO|nr:hypothetical protein [Polaribacter filamentus]PQB07308.1 hypothetical protein BST83_09175 [Polaribacter filamentus]
MKYKLNILLLIITLISTKAIACNCSIPKSLKAVQDYEFENSECIFIGEVLKIDSEKNTFEIRVVESFNGDEIGKIYSGIYDNQCGPTIDGKGKWLIYANSYENKIEINTCGLTRSFEYPESNITATSEFLKTYEKEYKQEKRDSDLKFRAQLDLKNEIINLRKRRK